MRPHHVPKDWIAKFKGQFDQGWDKLREETFARQKKLGVIPQDTILTPRPANMPAWDSLDARQKELFAHMAEIYAAFLAYDDYNIGRVIEAVKQEGLADNTLIIFIEGDNGGSAEGTLQGTANEVGVIGNGAKESFDYLYSIKDELGGPLHYNHMPVPWSWAFDTPFQWTKRYASHFGGTRNGMVMSWPKRIKDVGTLREQFHYVTDIMPTILEAAGVQAPDMINGAKQLPIDGISMAYTWDDAKAPTRRATQLFEMFGNRGIYHNGWMASTTPLVFAWEPEPKGITPESFNWELYDLTKDFSQGNDLAKAMPEKLKQMEELWWAEAGRNNALPLNFSPMATVQAVFQRPSLTRGRTHFVYRQGTVRIPEGTAPTVKNTSYTITAKLNVPEKGAEGVVITQGGRFAGWGLVVLDGKPVWAYKNTQQPNDGIRIAGPEQAHARRSRRERRLRLRRQEGRIRQGRRLRAEGGRRRSRQDHHQPHGALHLLGRRNARCRRGSRHAHPRRLRGSHAVQIQRQDRRGRNPPRGRKRRPRRARHRWPVRRCGSFARTAKNKTPERRSIPKINPKQTKKDNQ